MDINEAGLKLLGFESKEEALRTNIKETYVDPLREWNSLLR